MTATACQCWTVASATLLQISFQPPDSVTVKILWTLAALGGLVLFGYLFHRIGDLAEQRFSEGWIQTAEMALDTVLVAMAAWIIAVAWNAVGELDRQLETLNTNPSQVGVSIVISLLTLAVAYGVTRVAGRLIRHASDRAAVTDHRQEVAIHLVQVVAYVVAGFVVLGVWRVDLSNLLVGAGFLGLVLGLAARQTLGVVIAGFVLLFSRPFELGDWVIIDDREGVVTDITIHNTKLRTFEGEYVMIPNDKVTGTDIVNRSRRGRLRVSVDVGVDYESDPDHAAEVAREAMQDVAEVLDKPDPMVIAKAFGDSAVVLELRFWIDDPSARKMWRIRTEVVKAVKDAFERENISIPFPQRVLSRRGQPEAEGQVGSMPVGLGRVHDDAGDGE